MVFSNEAKSETLETRDGPRYFGIAFIPHFVRVDRYRDGDIRDTQTFQMDSAAVDAYRQTFEGEPGFRRICEPYVDGWICYPDDPPYDRIVVRITDKPHVACLSVKPAYWDTQSELEYLMYALQCDDEPIEIRDGKAIFDLQSTLFADDWAFDEWNIMDIDRRYRSVELHFPPGSRSRRRRH